MPSHIVEATSPPPTTWRHDRVLWLLLGCAALLGLIYNYAIMLGYAPDETRHMAYVKLLLEERTLPYLQPDGNEYRAAHTLHPPLYYALLVPVYALTRGLPGELEWHVVRLVSLLICLAALPLIYQIAWRAAAAFEQAQRRNVARLATAHVALLPMLGMSSGSINNDSGTLLLVTLFIWLLCEKYFEDRSLRTAVVLGLVMGAAGLCKLNALLSAVAALGLYFVAQDGPRALITPRVWMRGAVVIGVAALLLSPWFVRNFNLYGQLAPIPPPMPNPTGGDWGMVFHPEFASYFGLANWGLLATMWSQKDWIPEAIRPAINCVLFVYVMLALVGGVIAWKNRRQTAHDDDVAARIARWSSYGAFALNWIAVVHGAMFLTWGWAEGGRYLLPSLCGIAIALSIGWRQLTGAKVLWILWAWGLALLALNAVCIYWLLAYLNPTFGPK